MLASDAPVEALLRGLDDDDVAVRVAAARAIGKRRPDGVVAALRARIGRERDVDARGELVVALVRVGEDALLREVARALRSQDTAVVAGAARVLGAVGDRRCVPNLVEAFKTDDVVVGDAVAHALGLLGDVVVVPWLVAAAEQGFCVTSSLRALGRLGDRRALSLLQRFRDDDDDRIRLAAREALHRFAERGDAGDGDDDGDDDDDDHDTGARTGDDDAER